MKYLDIFAYGIVMGVGAFVLFHGLGQGPLAPYDEGTYAQIVHESFARHDFLTFTYFGNLFFEKPPLYFWLAGIAAWVTSSPVLGIRLPAALAALATVALVMYLARRLTRAWWVGALAGAFLLSIPLYIEGAREARFDTLVGLCVLLAFYFAWERKYFWFAIAVALAMLSKSVLALFAALALLCISLWRWEWSWMYDRVFWKGTALAAAIVLPWHLYEWALYGNRFWFSYLGVNVFQRFQTNLFVDPNLQTDYWARLLDYARPELGIFLLAAVAAVLLRDRRTTAALGSILSLLAFMSFIFFSAKTRALSYLLPLYPFAALVVGLSASLVLQRCRARLSYDTHENNGGTS